MATMDHGDRIRLRGLGVCLEPEPARPQRAALSDDDVIIALHEQLAEAVRRERRAWAEARRWRLWGYVCLLCAAASVAVQIVAAVARRGGW